MSIKTFRSFTEESIRSIVLIFGRFNPPSAGHEALFKFAQSYVGQTDTLRIYAVQSQDAKNNPLPYGTKIKWMRKMYPSFARSIIFDKSVSTMFDALNVAHSDGFTKCVCILASNQVSEFKSILNKYIAKNPMFKHGVQVISAGEQDLETVNGISSAKMRQAVEYGDIQSFRSFLPKSFADAEELFNDCREGMKKKPISFFREHVQLPSVNETREMYIRGEIFNVDERVQDVDGNTYKISERHTNYVTVISECDGQSHRFFINKIKTL